MKKQNYPTPSYIQPFQEAENKWEAKLVLKAIVFPPIKVLPWGYGFMYNNTFDVNQNKKSY